MTDGPRVYDWAQHTEPPMRFAGYVLILAGIFLFASGNRIMPVILLVAGTMLTAATYIKKN
ncbi:MAG: hypothetical protein HGA85_01390 [Nanoarchaeota archaeon]|nr:hypothetical protein [Nanoarchaeota archaeon]